MKKLIALLSLKAMTKDRTKSKHPGQTTAQYKASGKAYLQGVLGLSNEELKELEKSARERENN